MPRGATSHATHNACKPHCLRRVPSGCWLCMARRCLMPSRVAVPLQAELQAELEDELRGYGISPRAQRLTDGQLADAAAELERRRGASRQAMSPSDRQRYDYMRATVGWHVQRVRGWAVGDLGCSTLVGAAGCWHALPVCHGGARMLWT